MTEKNKSQCPICRKPVEIATGAFGLFCSSRCKLIDLGKWLGEEYRIESPLRPEHFEGFEDLPESPDLDRPAEMRRMDDED